MKAIWEGMTQPVRPNDIVKLAVGPFKEKESQFSNWEAILSEIIVGDSVGVASFCGEIKMERLQRAAVLSFVAQELLKNGSWCGETHIQKAVYLLQEICEVPTGFEFILYMYGPFSFDLSDELTSIRADGLLKIAVQYPYGPKLVPTDAAEAVQKRFPKTMQKYGKPVVFIASKIGAKTVADLEKLATALYVERKYDLDDEDIDSWARQMNALKSHVSVDAARAAIEDLQQIEDEASEM